MAIYEYFCPQCRKVFEVMRPMSKGDNPAFCPKCKSQSEKLLSVFVHKFSRLFLTFCIISLIFAASFFTACTPHTYTSPDKSFSFPWPEDAPFGDVKKDEGHDEVSGFVSLHSLSWLRRVDYLRMSPEMVPQLRDPEFEKSALEEFLNTALMPVIRENIPRPE